MVFMSDQPPERCCGLLAVRRYLGQELCCVAVVVAAGPPTQCFAAGSVSGCDGRLDKQASGCGARRSVEGIRGFALAGDQLVTCIREALSGLSPATILCPLAASS